MKAGFKKGEGTPAKMSRVTSIVSDSWQQAMIAHVWSGDNNSLTLDPASGVKGQTDSIQTNGQWSVWSRWHQPFNVGEY